MVVSAQLLIEALKVLDLVPSRSGVLPSEVIQITAEPKELRFSLASDLHGTVRVPVAEKEEWEFFVHRAYLMPFVLAGKSFKGDFHIEYSPKQLIVKQGRRRYAPSFMSSVTGYGLPKHTGATERLQLDDEAIELTALATKYATPDPTTAHLNCVYLTKAGHVYASNQLAVFHGGVSRANGKASIPLPVFLTTLLQKGAELLVSEKAATLRFPNGVVFQTVSEKAFTDFPLKTIKERFKDAAKLPAMFTVSAKAFHRVLERLQSYSAASAQHDVTIQLEGRPKYHRIRATCEIPGGGKFEESIPTQETEEFTCHWLMSLLAPMSEFGASHNWTFTASFDEGKKSLYLLQGDGCEILLPRKI